MVAVMDDSERREAAELPTTLVLALTAVGAALVAIFGSDGWPWCGDLPRAKFP